MTTHPSPQELKACDPLNGATTKQIERANAAVAANMLDEGTPRYGSSQGYACALTAIMQSDEALSQPKPDGNVVERVARIIDPDAFHESVNPLPKDGLATYWMSRRNKAFVKARSIIATAALDVSLVERMREDWLYLHKWIERGLFDQHTPPTTALECIAYHPSAPWNNGRWDVDHKPYAEAFYAKFPKAAALKQEEANHD